jgi:hypothetical protein
MTVAEDFQFSHQGVPPLGVRAPEKVRPFFCKKTEFTQKKLRYLAIRYFGTARRKRECSGKIAIEKFVVMGIAENLNSFKSVLFVGIVKVDFKSFKEAGLSQ